MWFHIRRLHYIHKPPVAQGLFIKGLPFADSLHRTQIAVKRHRNEKQKRAIDKRQNNTKEPDTKSASFARIHPNWQGRRDSNTQPTVLETVTLPIELLPYVCQETNVIIADALSVVKDKFITVHIMVHTVHTNTILVLYCVHHRYGKGALSVHKRLQQLRRFWRNIPHTSRVFISVEPMWSIANELFSPFLTLYLLETGFSNTTIGLFFSLYTTSRLVLSLVAGYLVDWIGRRWALFLSNIIGWPVYLAVLLCARTPPVLMLAALCYGMLQIGAVAIQCILAEDTRPDQRVGVVTSQHTLAMLSGFFAPLGGVVVGALGLISGERLLISIGIVLIGSQNLIRFLSTKESDSGRAVRMEVRRAGIRSAFTGSAAALRTIFTRTNVLMAACIYALAQFLLVLRTTWQSVYFANHLLVPRTLLPLVPMLGSLLFFAAVPVFNSLFSGTQQRKGTLAVALTSLVLSCGILLLPVQTGLPTLLLNLFGMAMFHAGAVMVLAYAEAGVLREVPEESRARIMALQATLSMLFTAPAGLLSGWLADFSIRLPFVLFVVMTALCAVCGGILARTQSKANG